LRRPIPLHIKCYPLQNKTGLGLDKDSVALLLERHYQGLLSLLRRRIGDPDLAHDMLGQGILTALEHHRAGRVSDPAAIAGYAFGCAMQHFKNRRRNFDDRPGLHTDVEALESVHGQVTAGIEQELVPTRQVKTALESLPTERDRLIVRRFYLDEEEKDVLCREFKLTAAQFDRVICRARLRMRALLESSGLRKPDLLGVLLCFA
jgi:RNA polymerase sigma-70 factor, ECF subfamily